MGDRDRSENMPCNELGPRQCKALYRRSRVQRNQVQIRRWGIQEVVMGGQSNRCSKEKNLVPEIASDI